MNINASGNTGIGIRMPRGQKKSIVECKAAGLDRAEAEENREKYGRNVLSQKKKEGFFIQLIKSFNDPIIKILMGALVINAVASLGKINWAETVGIALAILIATLVSTISEYTSSKAYEKLSREGKRSTYSVIRKGRMTDVFLEDIVVGDRILLFRGQTVPCDGILVSGTIGCDQSALTGESREVVKNGEKRYAVDLESFNFDLHGNAQVFRGAGIVRGEGEMIALRVGDATFIGEIAGSLQDNTRPSPLKHRLGELAKTIGFMGYVGAFMIAFAYLFNSFFIKSGMDMAMVREKISDVPYLISEILRAVTVAVSVVVVAVPEGLPMMITVVLSSNMKRMMKGGVLVRRLVGIETAGNLNILFTDKTGTLTTGRMSVVALCGYNRNIRIGKDREGNFGRMVKECIGAVCWGGGGANATEKALFSYAKTKVFLSERIPFSSDVKFSAGLDKKGVSYFAGAPEVILEGCKRAVDEKDREILFDKTVSFEITEKQRELSEESCRVLCLAKGDAQAFERAKQGELSSLTFVSLVALRDPVRKDVFRSVSDCTKAGIQVVMVTGDNPETARAVALETGIITADKDTILEASRLHGMSDGEVSDILHRVAVVSRALPADKIRLVRIAEEMGKVVGMTGDGINDAPALKAADVGFAMGSGTEIAKNAGDIVITDDSFSSITRAVLFGRTVFHSIRKFIVFQLMMNLSAMGISLIGPFMGIESPVTVIQMLWVNIIMDTLGGLAFAGEPALRKYMLRKSPPRDAKLISKRMLSQILLTGGYTLILGIFFLKSTVVKEFFGGDGLYHLTAFFAMFIFCGIFNSFNARTEKVNVLSCIAGNKPFIFIMTLVAAVQLLIIYFGGEVFRCTPLEPVHLLYCALIALTVIPADMIRKMIFK